MCSGTKKEMLIKCHDAAICGHRSASHGRGPAKCNASDWQISDLLWVR